MSYEIELLKGFVFNTVPTVYQEGMSYYEVLQLVVAKLNELIKKSNDYFSVSVKDNLIEILHTWQEDGTLDVIIDEALQTQIDDVQDQVHKISDSVREIGINVKSHNLEGLPTALGDGVTDDTVAIQTIINYANSNGIKKIIFPTAVYKISAKLQMHNNLIIEGNSSTLSGEMAITGIGKAENERRIEGLQVSNLTLENFNVCIDTSAIEYAQFNQIYTTNCNIGFLLGTTVDAGGYYNTFISCGNRGSTKIGVKTDSSGSSGPNTNSFYGCKIYGTEICLETSSLTNLTFYGCSIESGSADYILKMVSTLRSAFFGCRFEGRSSGVNPIVSIDEGSSDNAFMFCTFNGYIDLRDNGTRTTFFQEKSAALFKIGYSLLPNDRYAKIGDTIKEENLFNSLNGRQLNLTGSTPAILNIKKNYEDTNNTFVLSNTGKMSWGGGNSEPDMFLARGGQGWLTADTNSGFKAKSFEATDYAGSYIASSPDGSRWRIRVNNDGELSIGKIP